MITISEKDDATIIVIENPSGSEKRVIEQARQTQQVLSSNVWQKFACNKKQEISGWGKKAVSENTLPNDFEEIINDDEIPF